MQLLMVMALSQNPLAAQLALMQAQKELVSVARAGTVFMLMEYHYGLQQSLYYLFLTLNEDFIMLIELIENKKFEKILVFLQDEKNDVNSAYVDQAGNNLVHTILITMQERIKELYLPFRSRKTVYCKELKPSNESARELLELIHQILLLLKQRGCSFSHKNRENQNALDFFKTINITYFDPEFFKNLEVFLVKTFESEAHVLLAGRKYVSDLTLFRGSKTLSKQVEIPDKFPTIETAFSLHQWMASYESHLVRFKFGSGAKNFAVATLGFVVSSTSHIKKGSHGRRLVTIPFYLKNLAIKVKANRHSEVALLDNLKRDMDMHSQSALVAQLFEQCNRQQGVKVYDVILDIHSTREVCRDCDTHLREFQTDNSEGSFTQQCVEQLKRKGFTVSEKRQPPISLVVRASGLDDPSWLGNPDPLVVMPMFYAALELDRDIRHHHPGVLFHLPPMVDDHEPVAQQGKRYYSAILGHPGSEEMNVEYKRRKLNGAGHPPVLTPLSISPFTAFANGGGKAQDEVITEELLRSSLELSPEQLERVMSI